MSRPSSAPLVSIAAILLWACPAADAPPSVSTPDVSVDGTLTQFACETDEDCAFLPVGPCESFLCELTVGQCVHRELPPDCSGQDCGPALCGFCGDCPEGELCVADGACVEDQCGGVTNEGCCTAAGTLQWCGGGSGQVSEITCGVGGCGWSGDFYDCTGFATASDDEAHPYLCEGEVCPTSCEDQGCGWSCGEPCGVCEEGSECTASAFCLSCDAVGLEGCCDGGDMYYCFDDRIIGATCGGGLCGWNATSGYYTCGYEGEDPTGTYIRDCRELMAAYDAGQEVRLPDVGDAAEEMDAANDGGEEVGPTPPDGSGDAAVSLDGENDGG